MFDIRRPAAVGIVLEFAAACPVSRVIAVIRVLRLSGLLVIGYSVIRVIRVIRVYCSPSGARAALSTGFAGCG